MEESRIRKKEMEGRKQSGSSSFTSDLFGSKDSSASSAGIFGSIFAPSPKVLGRESVRPETVEKKQNPGGQLFDTKPGTPEIFSRSSVVENQNIPNKDMSSFYQEEQVQPYHLSSSIFYGGRDVYSNPHDSRKSGDTTFTKDGGEDDSGSASRGNWWQGSLYY